MTSNSFADLGVPARLISNLSARGITEPFPIQVKTLPETMAGRDVLGRGKTGSGKTLAFSIPLVTRLEPPSAAPATRPAWCWHLPASWRPRSPQQWNRWPPATA